MSPLIRFSLLLLIPALVCSGERWALQYFYDEHDSELRLLDIAFCSEKQGIAAGAVVKRRGRPKGATLVTSDGGITWILSEQDDIGTSIFLTPDCTGWITGEKGIWYTEEGGRDWRRISKERVEKVHFLDAKRGFAVGDRKRLLSTEDGGRSWKLVPAAKDLESNTERTVFRAIDFVGEKLGIAIANTISPRRSERVPIWMDTDPELRRERPSLTVVLQTSDGGKTWHPDTSSTFGAVHEITYDRNGRGLLLIRFSGYFEYPSEVYRVEAQKKTSIRTLRRKDLAVTDVAITDGGPAFAAGHQVRGRLAELPIPEKVQILKSADLNAWAPMDVDYRAVARYVSLAVLNPTEAWAATDTGMILRLVKD